jgi:2-methylaconitate cis-trans-isomerase PrpF
MYSEIKRRLSKLRTSADEHELLLNARKNYTGRIQAPVSAAYYRGGTSRAIIFREEDLPTDPDHRRSLFLQAIGAPDRHGRQLNGMGAGVSSLSKICIVKLRGRADPIADLDYTFVGMGIESDEVDYAGNCGNMASAIGPYAKNTSGLRSTFKTMPGHVGDETDVYTVRILNTNTGKVIRSTFNTSVDDSTSIDGVSGLGTTVKLDFINPGGSKTGKLLPTGRVVDIINGVPVSCVDAANPCVFVLSKEVEIDPTILPDRLLGSPFKLHVLEELRTKAAVMMGLCKEGETVPRVIPKIAIVSEPLDQTVLSGELIPGDSLDLVVRFISDRQPHRAIPLTAALCTASAAKISGSVVHQCLRSTPVTDGLITIGHPSGRIEVNATMDANGDVECATVMRTTRRLMEGKIFWNPPASSESDQITNDQSSSASQDQQSDD